MIEERDMKRSRAILGPALLAVLAVLAGCGKELTAGGLREVEVVATDRGGPDPAAEPAAEPSGARWAMVGEAGDSPARQQAGAVGTVEMEAAVDLIHESGQVVRVVDPPAAAHVVIGAAADRSLGRRQVPAGRYIAARVHFHTVEAVLTAGVGVRLAVDIGPEPLPVERTIFLEVNDRTSAVVEVDLNVATWLSQADAALGVVSREAFEAAVRVRVRE
jgi:hypothetical protein